MTPSTPLWELHEPLAAWQAARPGYSEEEMRRALALESDRPAGLRAISIPIRRQVVQEAIGFPLGPDTTHPRLHAVYKAGAYEVYLAKPGKEAAPGYRRPNRNDMRPCVRKNSRLLDFTPTFADVFDQLIACGRHGDDVLHIIGALLVRGAFMLDSRNHTGSPSRLSLPERPSRYLRESIPSISELPVDVFFQVLDCLAWNEDVKYHTLGYDISKGYGRENTLLTCAHVVAVVLGNAKLSNFAGSFARPPVGVAPLSLKRAREIFPLLRN